MDKLTDRQIRAYLDGCEELPEYGYSSKCLDQIQNYRVRRYDSKFKLWTDWYRQKLDKGSNRERSQLAAMRHRTPYLEVLKSIRRGRKRIVSFDFFARANKPVAGDRYMILYRLAGSEYGLEEGWEECGCLSSLPKEDGSLVARLDATLGHYWEFIVMLEAIGGTFYSQPIIVDTNRGIEIEAPTLEETMIFWKGRRTKDGKPYVSDLQKIGFSRLTLTQRDKAWSRIQ